MSFVKVFICLIFFPSDSVLLYAFFFFFNVGLELAVLLPQSFEGWNCKSTPPLPTFEFFILSVPNPLKT